MLTAHELFGFMSPDLADQILEATYADNRDVYRATLNAVAQSKRVRPLFLERQPRKERHKAMAAALARPSMEEASSGQLRGWLVRHQSAVLIDFLNALGIAHKEGVVEELPPSMEDAKLAGAVDALLGKHPQEVVVIYLHAFNSMNGDGWPNLQTALENDARLQFTH